MCSWKHPDSTDSLWLCCVKGVCSRPGTSCHDWEACVHFLCRPHTSTFWTGPGLLLIELCLFLLAGCCSSLGCTWALALLEIIPFTRKSICRWILSLLVAKKCFDTEGEMLRKGKIRELTVAMTSLVPVPVWLCAAAMSWL